MIPRLLAAVLTLFLAGGAVAEDWSKPQDVERFLEKAAGALTWPTQVESTEFKVSGGDKGLIGIAKVNARAMTQQEENRAVLASGLAYGAAMSRGARFSHATVLLTQPKGKQVVLLPLHETRELGDEFLRSPRNESAFRDRILFFTAKVQWYEPK